MNSPVLLEKNGNKIVVKLTSGHEQFNEALGLVRNVSRQHGGAFNPNTKLWELPLVSFDDLTSELNGYRPDYGPMLSKWLAEVEALQSLDLNLPEVDGRTYADHQKVGINWIVRNANSLLLDDQGLGKTMQAAVAMRMRYESGAARKFVIICPKAVVDVWLDELKLCFPEATCFVLDKKRKIPNDTTIVITHYERARRSVDDLSVWEPDMITLDESHRVKNRQSVTAKAISSLQPKFRLAMTGTVLPNKVEDVWFQVNWAVPGYFPDYWTWLRVYANLGNRFSKYAVSSYKNLDQLKHKINAVSLRRTKDEVLDLPTRLFQVRHVHMTAEQIAVYEQIRQDLIREFDDDGNLVSPNSLTKFLRLAQAASNPQMINDEYPESTTKYDEALSLIEDTDSQVIVWSCYRYDLHRMKQILDAADISSVLYHGDTSPAERQAAIRDFQAGKVRVFLGSPAACREGITLTAADTMIYLNRSFNAVDRLQSQDRNYRIGQDNRCMVYDIVTAGTLDELTLKALKGKSAMNQYAQSQTLEQEITVSAEDLRYYLERAAQ
jgi:SNF2 family DNA or RNA helicase